MSSDFSYIYLFTDFGSQGPYLAQMESAILQIAPGARIISLQSDAPVSNPRAAAYLLAALSNYLPKNSLVVSVVDPGVGGRRRALLVESEGRSYVGPDNGLLSQVMSCDRDSRVTSIHYDLRNLSTSFHGRDLFAPVAARLFNGSVVDAEEIEKTCIAGAEWADELAEIIYLDSFGNLFTGIRGYSVLDTDRVLVAGIALDYARTFCEVPAGALFWYRNSIGLVEIAANQERACSILDCKVGSGISIIS